MRWDNLFDDLESQLERELGADDLDVQAEEERLRLARLGLRERLVAIDRGGEGKPPALRALQLTLTDGSRVSVTPTEFGRDWMTADLADLAGRTRGCIVPLDAVAGISLDRGQIAASLEPTVVGPTGLSARLGIQFVLRDLCRRRQPVEIRLLRASAPLYGTIDRVGRDHLDLAVHEVSQPRRESAVTEYRLVRFDQLVLVRV